MSDTHERELKLEVIRLTADNYSQADIAKALSIDIGRVQKYQSVTIDPNRILNGIKKLDDEIMRLAHKIGEHGGTEIEQKYLNGLMAAMMIETRELLNINQ